MLTCGISGGLPAHPVVTRTGGVLYEKALIEAYVDAHHRCPVTGEPLEREDLLPLRVASLTSSPSDATPSSLLSMPPPTTTTTTAAAHQLLREEGVLGAPSADSLSIPSAVPTLVDRLQTEWCGMQLEQFTLRQQLLQTQQALAHALHKNEAAVRVVGRLASQVDVLEQKLLSSQQDPEGPSTTKTTGGVIALPAGVAAVLDAHAQQQRECRRRQHQVSTPTTTTTVVERPVTLSMGAMDTTVDDAGAFPLCTTLTCVPTLDGASHTIAMATLDGKLHVLSGSACGSGSKNNHNNNNNNNNSASGSGGERGGAVAPVSMSVSLAGVGHTDAIHTLTTFPRHPQPPSGCTETNSGGHASSSWLLSGSYDKTVKLWELMMEEESDGEDNDNDNEEVDDLQNNKGGSAEPPQTKRPRTEGGGSGSSSSSTRENSRRTSSGNVSLLCRQTLFFPHGVTTMATTTVGGDLHHRFLFSAGGIHSPHVYLSDVERGEHTASVDLFSSTRVGVPRDFAVGSSVAQVALHPYGTIGGLLIHQPTSSSSSSSLSSSLWDGSANTTMMLRGGRGISVVALWDVKAMARDTLIPITPAMLLEAEKQHGQGRSPPSSSLAAAASGVAVSVDFAPDAVTMAVGLSTGAALVWDLRKVQEPVTYIPPTPTARVLLATAGGRAGSSSSSSSSLPCPAVVRFCPSLRRATVLAVAAGTEVSCYSSVGSSTSLWKRSSSSSASATSGSGSGRTLEEQKKNADDDDVVPFGGGRAVLHPAPLSSSSASSSSAFCARDVCWTTTCSGPQEMMGLVVASYNGGVACCDVVMET